MDYKVDSILRPFFIYEKNLKCRLQVLDVCFRDGKEIAKAINDKMNEENNEHIGEEDLMNTLKREDIMEIYCSMSQEGLGPIKWWE